MPPVSSSRSYDYDYDAVQPYFLLDGEEDESWLPPGGQPLPGPGEDIWKKFELLPTPPLSPRRRRSLSAADAPEASDPPDEDRYPSAAFLQSFIIQDCMWSSSFAAAAKLEQAVSQRLALLRARRVSSHATAADQRPRVNAGYLQDLHTAATDCIDPSEVFPYGTASEERADGAAGAPAPEPSPDSPPLSGSDSQSEEEEEEEEEEVDVVTVDRRRALRRSDGGGRADDLILKRSHVNIHQHNYAAPQPAGKRFKPRSGSPPPASASAGPSGGRRCRSPQPDGEDGEDKRRTHNVLERQRRNELKRSFAALRDRIPALAHNQKAAKVSILKKAAEVIGEMRRDERRLLQTKDELTKRSRALTRRLQQLRTSH